MWAPECSQAFPTKTPPPLISSPIWKTLIQRDLSLFLSFSLTPYPPHSFILHSFAYIPLTPPPCLWFMPAGPIRKPKYVESPRVPSDAIASVLRKGADNKELSHNGEYCCFIPMCTACLFFLFFFIKKNLDIYIYIFWGILQLCPLPCCHACWGSQRCVFVI